MRRRLVDELLDQDSKRDDAGDEADGAEDDVERGEVHPSSPFQNLVFKFSEYLLSEILQGYRMLSKAVLFSEIVKGCPQSFKAARGCPRFFEVVQYSLRFSKIV